MDPGRVGFSENLRILIYIGDIIITDQGQDAGFSGEKRAKLGLVRDQNRAPLMYGVRQQVQNFENWKGKGEEEVVPDVAWYDMYEHATCDVPSCPYD
ncbi:hypothetical protein N7454_008310 [Penicillium verhagenii]|nr:hypothetical protein N7454_008310 [Penicillium verhagenii]